jgi:hypothetical protein
MTQFVLGLMAGAVLGVLLAIIAAGVSRRGTEKSLLFGRPMVFGELRRAPTPNHKLPKPLSRPTARWWPSRGRRTCSWPAT